MNALRAGVALVAGLGLSGCHGNTPVYLVVQIAGSQTDPAVTSLAVSGTDSQGAIQTELISLPSATALAGTFLASGPSTTTTISLAIQALDANSVVRLVGEGLAQSLHPGANPTLDITLVPACPGGTRDCAADQLCGGTLACVDGGCYGQPLAPPALDGTPCGPLGSCLQGACNLPGCGDGVAQEDAGEQCDDGDDGGNALLPNHCRPNCQLPVCGDGVVDPAFGEKCDLGTANGSGVGCNQSCTLVGTLTPYAGSGNDAGSLDGLLPAAGFAGPWGLALAGSELFVVDSADGLLRAIDRDAGRVSTLAGHAPATTGPDGSYAWLTQDDAGTAASFGEPLALLAIDDGLIVGEATCLRRVGLGATERGQVSTLAGPPWQAVQDGGPIDGPIAQSQFSNVSALAMVPGSSLLFTAELAPPAPQTTYPYGKPACVTPIVRGVELDAGVGTLWAPHFSFSAGYDETGPIATNVIGLTSAGGALQLTDESLAFPNYNITPLLQVSTPSAVPTALQTATALIGPQGTPVSVVSGVCSDGRFVFVLGASPPAIWEWDTDGGTQSVLVSPGTATAAGIGWLVACVYDPATQTLFASDHGTNRIFQVQ